MDKEYIEGVETAFGSGRLSISAKNILLNEQVVDKARTCCLNMMAESELKGSKLSVFLDWLFSDPQRVMDLLLKILGIFISNAEQGRY